MNKTQILKNLNGIKEDYKKILDQMVKLTENKKSFDKDNLKNTVIDDKEYVVHENGDKTTFIDNSYSKDNRSIERELTELQKTQQKFQTSDKTQNTNAMIDELAKESELIKTYLFKLKKEKEALGIYMSGHPFEQYSNMYNERILNYH